MKTIRIFICIVALTGCAAADQNSLLAENPALLAKAEQNPVIKAELLQKHGLYAEAEKVLSSVIKTIQSENQTVSNGCCPVKISRADTDKLIYLYYARAGCWFKLDDFYKALTDYTESYRLDKDPKVLFQIGDCLHRTGQYDAAIVKFDEYLEKASPTGTGKYLGRYYRTLCVLNKGLWDEGLSDLKKLQEEFPEWHDSVQRTIDQALAKREELKAAEKDSAGNGSAKSDSSTGIADVLRQAEQGDVNAQLQMGRFYAEGIGVQNYEEAVKWFTAAAKQNHAYAQGYLGYLYEKGLGVPQNYEMAVKWYNLAAEQGCAFAQFKLGCAYYFAQGVDQSIPKAAEWYKKAVDQNYVDAFNNYAWILATCSDDAFRDGSRAVELVKKYMELRPEDPRAFDTLAAACAETGQFDLAVETQKKAIALLKDSAKSNLREDYLDHLQSYENKTPWRDVPKE